MNEIEKAIKACNEEIKFYKNELKQPYMTEYKSTYDAYISGHNEAYYNMQDGIKTFEFIKTVLKEFERMQWTPVSKGLPPKPESEEELKPYLVTLNEFAKIPMTLHYMGNGVWVKKGNFYNSVLAWTQLPERYKEGQE